jgi:hypothetical protein
MLGHIRAMRIIRFIIVIAAFALFAGCRTPDPTIGWQKDYGAADPAIGKDYQAFIKTFKPEGQRPTQVSGYFKDGTGRHAIDVEIFKYHQNASCSYFIIYDKDNKRIKILKYRCGSYQS